MMPIIRCRFKVTQAEAGGWNTSFTLRNLDHANPANAMSPEGLIHYLGGLAGLSLEDIAGLEFAVELQGGDAPSQPDLLMLCGRLC